MIIYLPAWPSWLGTWIHTRLLPFILVTTLGLLVIEARCWLRRVCLGSLTIYTFRISKSLSIYQISHSLTITVELSLWTNGLSGYAILTSYACTVSYASLIANTLASTVYLTWIQTALNNHPWPLYHKILSSKTPWTAKKSFVNYNLKCGGWLFLRLALKSVAISSAHSNKLSGRLVRVN